MPLEAAICGAPDGGGLGEGGEQAAFTHLKPCQATTYVRRVKG